MHWYCQNFDDLENDHSRSLMIALWTIHARFHAIFLNHVLFGAFMGWKVITMFSILTIVQSCKEKSQCLLLVHKKTGEKIYLNFFSQSIFKDFFFHSLPNRLEVRARQSELLLFKTFKIFLNFLSFKTNPRSVTQTVKVKVNYFSSKPFENSWIAKWNMAMFSFILVPFLNEKS